MSNSCQVILTKIVKFGKIVKDIARIKQTFLQQKHSEIMINIFQGSAVTQNALVGLIICRLFATFLQCIHAKNCENQLTCVKLI